MSLLPVGIIFSLTWSLKSDLNAVKVSLSGEKKSYGENTDCHCSTSIDSPFGLSRAGEIMKQRNVSSAWISVRKQELHGWTWVNGARSVNKISIPRNVSSREVECGFLQTKQRRGQVIAKCCFEKLPFLCQGNGMEMKEKRFSANGWLFSIHDEPNASWYEARTHCEKNNQTLAVLSGSSEHDRPVIEKLSILTEEKEQNVWIGVRRWDYFTDSCLPNKRKLVEEYFWHEDLDCHCTKEPCVILKMHGGTTKWMPAPCCSSHHYLCIEDTKHSTHNTDSKLARSTYTTTNIWKIKYSTNQYDDKSLPGESQMGRKEVLTFVLIAVVSLLLMVAVGFAFFYFIHRKRPTQAPSPVQMQEYRTNSTQHTGCQGNPDREPLVSQPRNPTSEPSMRRSSVTGDNSEIQQSCRQTLQV